MIERFVEICLTQNEALLESDTAKFNKLFDRMHEVVSELRSRPGDQRKGLAALYDHPNAQVRLKAATNTLAVAPAEARQVLKLIRERQEHPQALDAGMTLWNLDRGVFKPT